MRIAITIEKDILLLVHQIEAINTTLSSLKENPDQSLSVFIGDSVNQLWPCWLKTWDNFWDLGIRSEML